jgi:hypothetical protein
VPAGYFAAQSHGVEMIVSDPRGRAHRFERRGFVGVDILPVYMWAVNGNRFKPGAHEDRNSKNRVVFGALAAIVSIEFV